MHWYRINALRIVFLSGQKFCWYISDCISYHTGNIFIVVISPTCRSHNQYFYLIPFILCAFSHTNMFLIYLYFSLCICDFVYVFIWLLFIPLMKNICKGMIHQNWCFPCILFLRLETLRGFWKFFAMFDSISWTYSWWAI